MGEEARRRALVLVADGPGRSGADSTLRALGCHRSVTTPEVLKPALLAAAMEVLMHAPYDRESWLPRRAAQSVSLLIDRLCSSGALSTQAAACLETMASVTRIFVPVYGHLALPAPLPTWRWRQLLRTVLLNATAPGHAAWVAGKTGPWMSPLLVSLLDQDDALVLTIRHPVEAVLTLTESVVDSMRPAEAVGLVTLQLDHARRTLASCGSRAVVVRLEELVTEPESVLRSLAQAMGLPFEAAWVTAAATVLPSDIRSAPAWNHDHVRMHRRELSDLADTWGY